MAMGDEISNGDENLPFDDNMNGFGNQPEENQFDTNFDAGVEANEDEDPKKYIQQLTGKLSQKLRSYNENLPQPDADLNKFVAGMVVKQAIDGLSPEDTDDILNKVKNDEGEEINSQETQQDIGNTSDGDFGADMSMGESINKSHKKKIDELFGQVIQDNDDDKYIQEPITNIGYRKKPFTSPNFI